jgi:transposase
MLQPQPVGSIPDDTLNAAKAAIPGGNTCIKLRDRLGTIFHDSLFEPLFSKRDASHVARCQDDLALRDLLPKRQFVDVSYMGSQIALESRKRHNIELVGPAKQNWHRHQVESRYDLSLFKIDRNGHFAICPQGKKSTGWWAVTSHTGRLSIHTKFSRTDCAKCSVNHLCTKNGAKNSRKLALLPRKEHEWLAA